VSVADSGSIVFGDPPVAGREVVSQGNCSGMTFWIWRFPSIARRLDGQRTPVQSRACLSPGSHSRCERTMFDACFAQPSEDRSLPVCFCSIRHRARSVLFSLRAQSPASLRWPGQASTTKNSACWPLAVCITTHVAILFCNVPGLPQHVGQWHAKPPITPSAAMAAAINIVSKAQTSIANA